MEITGLPEASYWGPETAAPARHEARVGRPAFTRCAERLNHFVTLQSCLDGLYASSIVCSELRGPSCTRRLPWEVHVDALHGAAPVD